jgi:hypothetical protein
MEQKQIIAALVKAQLKIKAPVKDGINPVFKNKYATYDAIMQAVRIPLAEEGIAISHNTKMEGGVTVLVTRLLHISGESIESEFPMIIEKPTSQGVASANTYAKRQGVCNLLSLAGDDDDDGNAASIAKDKKEEKGRISPKQHDELKSYINGDKEITDRILERYKVKTLADLNTEIFPLVLNGVKTLKRVEA